MQYDRSVRFLVLEARIKQVKTGPFALCVPLPFSCSTKEMMQSCLIDLHVISLVQGDKNMFDLWIKILEIICDLSAGQVGFLLNSVFSPTLFSLLSSVFPFLSPLSSLLSPLFSLLLIDACVPAWVGVMLSSIARH